jgi:HTH-type transcriptional regulator/antitoxin HigA
MSVALADPVRMMQMGAPRLIESDEELARYTEELFVLTAKESPTADEIDAINLLSVLVQRYEAERFPIPDISAGSMMKYLMELKGVNEEKLAAVLGEDAPSVLAISDGRSSPTISQVLSMASFFDVSPVVFLPEDQ